MGRIVDIVLAVLTASVVVGLGAVVWAAWLAAYYWSEGAPLP